MQGIEVLVGRSDAQGSFSVLPPLFANYNLKHIDGRGGGQFRNDEIVIPLAEIDHLLII